MRVYSLETKKEVIKLYEEDEMSSCQIVDMLGIPKSTVIGWLKKAGVTRPQKRISEKQKELIRKWYTENKLSASQIANRLGINSWTVLYYLREVGIERRSNSLSSHIRRGNHVTLSTKAIEWLQGELLGDGCLRSQSEYSVYFIYDSKYEEYISYVSKTLEGFGIKQSGKIRKRVNEKLNNCVSYTYCSLSYAELLPLYKKWYPEGKKIVPKDIELTPLTCRQWYIGDGSLLKQKIGRPRIELSTYGFSIEDVELLVKKLHDLGFKASRQPFKNGIRISAYSTRDFLDYIGECPVECYKYKWDY